jgi:transcription elongation factor GreA
MAEIIYLSKEGYDNLIEELRYAVSVERPEISKQIAEARDKGDLSENAEYDAAKDAQGMLELRISKLELLVANSRIMDDENMDSSKVLILSFIDLLNHNTGKKVTYKLVNESEADHKTGKISIKSPIGNALIGKKVGDIIDVTVPAGSIKFEILKIYR